MTEITIRVIHEWRSGHADPLALIEEGMKLMTDTVARLTTAVDDLAAALASQSGAINEVATAIRNHPASTTDNGALDALAERLSGIKDSINNQSDQLRGLTIEEQNEDAGLTSEPVTEHEVGDSSGGDTGVTDDGTLSQPVDDGSGADPLDGGSTDDTSAAGADETIVSPDAGASEDQSAEQADTASGDGFQQPESDQVA